jgi:hypothetical protein
MKDNLDNSNSPAIGKVEINKTRTYFTVKRKVLAFDDRMRER